ncbi:MAG: hypothetical protein LBP52_05485 [Burkholderiaceae bacterium]|nr:hypothetical protein [Burkholderiaceae bacterium]
MTMFVNAAANAHIKMKKIFVFIVKSFVAVFLFLCIGFAMIFAVYWSQEKKAKDLCQEVIVGKYFDKSIFGKKKPIVRNENEYIVYKYIFASSPESMSTCKIILDGNNIVKQTFLERD